VQFVKDKLKILTQKSANHIHTMNSDWLLDLLNRTGLNQAEIQDEVNYLLWEYEFDHPNATPDEVLDEVYAKLIKWSISKGIASASITSVPMTLPVIGNIATAVLGTAVDMSILIRTQIELCYAIASAYHVSMTEMELKTTILALLGYYDNDDIAIDIVSTSFNQIIEGIATKFIARGLKEASIEVAERLSLRVMGKMVRWLPLISIPINASMNTNAIKAIGIKAKLFFQNNGHAISV